MIDFFADPTLLGFALLYSLLTLSMYITFACGLFSMANAAFMAIGAYVAGILAARAGQGALVATAAGVAASVGVALVVSTPMLRLRGIYLALLTFGFGQVVYVIANSATGITGGQLGLTVPYQVSNLTLALVRAAVLVLLLRWRTSIYGAAADALRQDEPAAESLGIPVRRYTIASFVASGGIAGLGGALWAQHTYFISPHDFGFELLLNLFLFAVVGGIYKWYGAVIGAFALTYLIQALNGLDNWRTVVLGALLTLTVLIAPQGLLAIPVRQLLWAKVRRRRPAAAVEASQTPVTH
jgi:branched-chain amino acid transport system permease protein